MKTNKKHFKIFKDECQKWIDKFELNNWGIHFGWTDKKGAFASLGVSLNAHNATFFLCKDWNDTIVSLSTKNIKNSAKHEVIHLLLARLAVNGAERFVTSDEMIEAEEELVKKLENLLK